MSESGTPGYVAVNIVSFRNVTRDITFDVFIRLGEGNMAHVFSRATGLDYKRLAQYIHKGVKELYVREEDYGGYQLFTSRTAESIFSDPTTPQEKKIATLLNMTEQNMAEVFAQTNVSEETADSCQRVVRNYVQLMIDSPKTLATILKLVSHGEYLYYHSIAVSIFSMFIARASGQFNQRTLELVAMGGFLHDIGFTQIPREILEKPGELTREEWSKVHQHPKLGMQMLEATSNIPDEVRYIVYQHHEEPAGKGYPNGLYGPVIYYPAKIVALADAFSAMISKRPYRPAFTVEQTIQILQASNGKHDRELVRMLSSIFLRPKSSAA